MSDDNELTEFEHRTRALLRGSADDLDAAMRSRLNRARQAALAGRTPRSPWLSLRYLAPTGAVAAAALAAILLVHSHHPLPVNDSAGSALDDMELLADGEGYELSQESDLDFIQWAAAMGERDPQGI